MFRLFFAAFLPSLVAVVMIPSFAHSDAHAPVARAQAEDDQQKKPDAVVNLADGRITPAVVTIRPGQTIRWTNRDNRDFSLVTRDKDLIKAFRSGTIKPGKSWDFTFENEGTVLYHCSLRPRAKGTVRVVAAEPDGPVNRPRSR